MRVYSLRAGRIVSSQAASITGGSRTRAISASRSRVLDMAAAVCWPTLWCFSRNACLSWVMSQVSVTIVPPSTGSSS